VQATDYIINKITATSKATSEANYLTYKHRMKNNNKTMINRKGCRKQKKLQYHRSISNVTETKKRHTTTLQSPREVLNKNKTDKTIKLISNSDKSKIIEQHTD
jgi:hypothetical protein